jgi:hypothetical protein
LLRSHAVLSTSPMAISAASLITPPVELTMRAAHSRSKEVGQGHGVVEAGELAEATLKGAGLSLAARKALLMLIRKAAGDAWQDREFSISKAELRGSHNSNDRLGKVLRELRSHQVALAVKERGRISDWEGSILSITKTDRDDAEGAVVRWRFSEIVREALRGSKTYAEMLEGIILRMESVYSLRLYEIGSLYCQRDHPVWRGDKAALRAMLHVPEGTYRNWADLERKALAQAKKELDAVAHFTMDYKTQKARGVVKTIEITFTLKQQYIACKPRRTRKKPAEVSSSTL